MESFIRLTAQDLLRRFGHNLRDVTVVFPNKRAGLFMNQQLAALAGKPVWAPRYRTISDLFDSLSDFARCDDIMAVCELHRVYAAAVADPEPLDRFYGWGEIMLSDFDDIDKHLADAHRLFSNIEAVKALDDSTFLTDAQEEALKRFFEGFSVEANSRLKEKFLALWNRMDEIYANFNENLRKKGMLYEGALYRDVVANLPARTHRIPEGTIYAFVGFNVLNDVEEALFKFLQTREQALFYWDYDVMYTREGSLFEAGEFVRRNLAKFPNALAEPCFDNLRTPPQIEFVATSSDNAQARYIPQWIATHLTRPEQDTAIVLCNESLLQPVLHALPDEASEHPVKRANITMGFPMADTPVYGFLNALLTLQTDGYDRDRHCFRIEQERIVRDHPYAALLDPPRIFCHHGSNAGILAYLREQLEELARAFAAEKDPAEGVYRQLYHEALYRAHQVVCRFARLSEEGLLDVEANTLRRLLRGVLGETSIPFHGEPAVGLQVMGLLETRNLNFRHILMLGVNEGMMPKGAGSTSFIPYQLREVFGLTTIRHKIAVYAFYFYRLLQRTERITFVYNTATTGTNKNEMSRFLRQLLAETDFPLEMKVLRAGQTMPATQELAVQKTPEMMERLWRTYAADTEHSRPLSPSALNAYIDCPMKFYYQQVARIRIQKNPQEGMDAALFGTIFHEAAQRVYTKLTERSPIVRQHDIARLLEGGDAALLPFVEASILHNFFEDDKQRVFYNGQLLVARKVLTTYLRQLLKHDSGMGQFVMQEMEQTHFQDIQLKSGGRKGCIKVGGIVDRMDTVMLHDAATSKEVETLRVVDYKTGGTPKAASSMEQLFRADKERPSYVFQIFLYAWILSKEQRRPVATALFYVHKSNSADYDPTVVFGKEPVTNFTAMKDDFEELLLELLVEIFNPEVPFRQTQVQEVCSHCDYKLLCGRNDKAF